MKVPLSWLKEFVDIELPIDELAYKLTLAGLEVEEIRFVGYPIPGDDENQEVNLGAKISGFAWDKDQIVVAAILEVMPHPNADRLVLCRLDDGTNENIVLTGAPNLFDYKGKGELESPLMVAYAREGAEIIDAYSSSGKTTKLKRKKIRGIDSYSMACSEMELGISDEHEGIIILDSDAPLGLPLADYLGDIVLDIAITPNIARNANILGVAREIAAITGSKLKSPSIAPQTSDKEIKNKVSIDINDPQLNPRFVVGMIENINIAPSPYKVQFRLKLAGMRPIDNIVDATNYTMLELGEPLHAFDYDVLLTRAGGKKPVISTRSAVQGETLVTLDKIKRELDDFTVLVCDQKGPLALAGVMGGAESEVSSDTKTILLEGASWNIINTRRTNMRHNLSSEAAYRFSRGVHPSLAPQGVLKCLEYMALWSGGDIYKGLVDEYPLPPEIPTLIISKDDVSRWLGIDLNPRDIAELLGRLEFKVEVDGENIRVYPPDHRLDIGDGLIGVADIMEEIARVYGYDNIPETRLSDELPSQHGNLRLDTEERIRDILVYLGLQEVITHRLTSVERDQRSLIPQQRDIKIDYVALENPISSDRNVLRQNLLSSVLEIVTKNKRNQERIAIFEIGPAYFPEQGELLPREEDYLAITLTGTSEEQHWQTQEPEYVNFYDMKGTIQTFLDAFHIQDLVYTNIKHSSFHPGKCASVNIREKQIGVFGEIHPLVTKQYELTGMPLLAAIFKLNDLLAVFKPLQDVDSVPSFPPVLEDLAIIVDEDTPSDIVEQVIRRGGGKQLHKIRLFDVYRGKQIGIGKKSLAYSLVYQAEDRTLTDSEVRKSRKRIINNLNRQLDAKLRD